MASTKVATNYGKVEKEGAIEKRSKLEQGSDVIDLQLCDLCEIEGSNIRAEGYCKTCGDYLCYQCYCYHCKPKPTRHHVLVDLQSMSTLPIELIEDCQEKCHKHENVPLKIYCRSHDEFGCVECLSDYHKACDNVSFIQDCAKAISESNEYQDFQMTIKTLKTNLNTQCEKAKTEAYDINEFCSILNTTDAIREITILMDDVKFVQAKIYEAKTTAGQMVDTVTMTFKDALSELQKLMLDQTSDTIKFVNMKRGQSIICKVRGFLETMKTDLKVSQTSLATLKADIKLSFEDIQNFVPVMRSTQACSAETKKSLEKIIKELPCTSIEVVSRHCCNIYEENLDSDKECRITGSAMLSDGRVAFVDFCNKALKIYSPLENTVVASFDFPSNPFDAAEVDARCIAVTVPSQRNIRLLSLDEPYKSTVIYTSGSCYGICCNQNVLYVTFEKPPKVEILDMTGAVLNSYDDYSEKLFSSPWYVAYNHVNSSLYITDRVKDTVTSLTTQGDVVSVYKALDFKRPYGVAIDSCGTVYVCSRKTDRLQCLSPDLKLITVIADSKNLNKPETVVCCNKRDRLYVGVYQDDAVSVLDIVKH